MNGTMRDHINCLCDRLKWTPADIARETGLDRQSTWRYLNGHTDTLEERAALMFNAAHKAASIKLVFDLPPVFAHNKGHWSTKKRKIKTMRELAQATTLAAQVDPLGKAGVHYNFWFPDRRVRDEANYIHACKPYLDGIVDAGLINDDRWLDLSTLGVTSKISKANPRVELVFTPQFPAQK